MRSGAHVDPLTRHSPAFRSTGRITNDWDRINYIPSIFLSIFDKLVSLLVESNHKI